MNTKKNKRNIFILILFLCLFTALLITIFEKQLNNRDISSLSSTVELDEKLPHEQFYCFFTNLNGWIRHKPTGRSAVGGGGIMSRCEYRQSDNIYFLAKVINGLLGQNAIRTVEAAKKNQENSAFIQTHHFEDLNITIYRDTVTKKNWVLLAVLDKSTSAVVQMTFVGIEPEQCLDLAKKFNWSTIKESINKVTLSEIKTGPGRPF